MLFRLINRLEPRKSILRQAPLQILSILCDEYGCANEAWRQELDLSIVAMEQRIVMSGFDIESFDMSIRRDGPLIKNLHRTNTNLTWLDCTSNFERNLREFSQLVIELCETTREDLGLRTISRKCRTRIWQEISSSANSCTNRQWHVRGLQKRTAVQISTVSGILDSKSGPSHMK